MAEKRLLDCTLRDGGFVNDWAFGHGSIVSLFERLVSARLDAIEVGFLDERRAFDRDRTIMPDTAAVDRIFEGLDKGGALVVGMIDYGTCGLDKLAPCAESWLDGIRVIFKKKDADGALAFCKGVMDKGYRLFVQPVSVTSYSDEEMTALVEKVNALRPFSMSIVDTYGLLHKNNLLHYFRLVDEHLANGIGIGYHSHNNFQLAYANSIELLECDLKRPLTVDSSLYGMGKGAGNAATELLSMYMNDHCGSSYDINQILEAIDVNVLPVYRRMAWGYSFEYYLAASNDCHPHYVKHLSDKRTLSAKSINELLARIAPDKRLSYDKAHMEALYLDYQRNEVADEADLESLGRELEGRPVLLVGPGRGTIGHEAELRAYVMQQRPVVVAINHIPEVVEADMVFVSNAKRYVQLADALHRGQGKGRLRLIATSNVTCTRGCFDHLLNYSSLLLTKGAFPDNSLIMFLKVLLRLGVDRVALAGFDGYGAGRAPNYAYAEMEYPFTDELAAQVNRDVSEFLAEAAPSVRIEFLTESLYRPKE